MANDEITIGIKGGIEYTETRVLPQSESYALFLKLKDVLVAPANTGAKEKRSKKAGMSGADDAGTAPDPAPSTD